jgi:hypothetical protein
MKEFARKWRIIWSIENDSKDELKEDLKKRLDKDRRWFRKKSEALDELKELNDKIKMKIYWINWISLNRKVKTNTEFGAVGRTDQKYYVKKEIRQLVDKLDKLSEKQDKLAENENAAVKRSD